MKEYCRMSKSFSTVGLGCVTFGREIDQSASFALMDCAQANGITFFDTASIYGGGASEAIIGAWRAMRRPASDPIMIATKILPPYSPRHISESVDESRKRIGIDTIDLLYLHRWDPSIETPAVLEALNNLICNRKVRMLGASNFSARQLSKALGQQTHQGFDRFCSVQNNHNLAVSDISEKFRLICTGNNIAIVTYSPLGAGFLTGKYLKGVAGDTRFAMVPGHQDIYFTEAASHRLNKLLQVAARTGYTPAHLALAWALHQPRIASVLIGARTITQLDQAFAALAFNAPALFDELELSDRIRINNKNKNH